MLNGLPVRVFDVYYGASAEDPDRRRLLTFRKEDDAQALVLFLEGMKARNTLIDADCAQHFFQVADDRELNVDAPTIAAAIASGYLVQSVVLPLADIPVGRVLAKISGNAVDIGDAPDPADVAQLGVRP